MNREITSRRITADTNVEFLKKEAKRWLKSLEERDSNSIARLKRALPELNVDDRSQFTLRTVQHALAREHGVDGWIALTTAIETHARELREIADEILRNTIYRGDFRVAARLFNAHPEIAKLDLYTAVAAGDSAEVERRLKLDPQSANRVGGPLKWAPILYLAHSRLPGSAAHSVEIARTLLDHGADPNAAWDDGWGNAFRAVTGAIALGEGVPPTHERADELVDLLVERGADPCDSQAFYNTSIVGDDVHWLEVLWRHSERLGATRNWTLVSKKRIGGHRNMSPIDFMLSIAVSYNHVRRAEWLLARGANVNGAHAYSNTGRRLLDEALVYGNDEMAGLLKRQGATDDAKEGLAAFQIACRGLDREAARRLSETHPEYLQDAELMIIAARQGRLDIIELLLDLGVNIDIKHVGGFRAIHTAIASNKIEIVKFLVARGSDVDAPTDNYGGPVGFAAHFGRRDIAEILAPLSRDVHNLVHLGMKNRLQELFAAEPALVNAAHFRDGLTPLFSLPSDEASAIDMARFLLERGADPRIAAKDGGTAADAERKRGFNEVARLLVSAMN